MKTRTKPQKREKPSDHTGLLPNRILFAKNTGQPWDEDRDDLYDKYFDGWSIPHLANHFGRDESAIVRQLDIIKYSDKASIVQKYVPKDRISRVGKRFTRVEIEYALWHKTSHQTPKTTAKILARSEKEVYDLLETYEVQKHKQFFAYPLMPTDSAKDRAVNIAKLAKAIARFLDQ